MKRESVTVGKNIFQVLESRIPIPSLSRYRMHPSRHTDCSLLPLEHCSLLRCQRRSIQSMPRPVFLHNRFTFLQSRRCIPSQAVLRRESPIGVRLADQWGWARNVHFTVSQFKYLNEKSSIFSSRRNP